MANPFFSIIIPTYNVEEYIGRCLDSILKQSFDNYEIICVDDHSIDSTVNIIRQYSEKYEKIILIEYEHNKSAHCARIDGFNKSKGKYIWFIDGDDEISTDSLEKLYNYITKRPVDIFHFGTLVINDGDLPEKRIESMQRFTKPYEGRLSGHDVFEACFVDGKYRFNIWNKLFDRDLCIKAFQCMRYTELPKAQDKYEYYVLSYYARSYWGTNVDHFYIYHFGTGITGHTYLAPPSFERYCKMKLSFDEIESFSIRSGLYTTYEEMISKIGDQLFDDCYANWNNNVASEDKGICFDLMVDYWGIDRVISSISNKNWYNQGAVANQLLSSKKMICPPRNIKTIGTFYHTYRNGGVQRVLTGLMKIWLSLGYKVVLFTDEEPTSDDYYFPDEVKRIVICSSNEVTRSTYCKRSEELRNALKENNVDVMVYHAWVSNILLWDLISCKLEGVPFISHCHNIFSMLLRSSRAYFAALPNIYRLCDGIVTLSDVDKTFWSNFNNNVHEVFNPFSFKLDDVPKSSLNNNTIIWLGRISDEKRPQDAIKILGLVRKRVPDAKLILVGGGSEGSMNKLYRILDQEELRDAVVMYGFALDVLPLYQLGSVFLCTSEYEGFLLTLAESQSAGLPCVMYELPYLTLTRKKMGVIQVPQMNKEAAADEIIRLLQNRSYLKQMGSEARACIESYKNYDFNKKWSNIIKSVESSNIPLYKDDVLKIMWDTMMIHYRTGVLRNNKKIDELSKRILGEQPFVDDDYELAKYYKQELDNIKNSFSYKLGEVLTYIPKLIRGDFKK